MKHIISLGEILVDVIPNKQLQLGEPCYTPHPGGAAANVAVAIARLGGSSRFIGAASADAFGRQLVQVLAENQVDTQFVHIFKDAPTAIALVTLATDGQRRFAFFRQEAADTLLRVEDLNWNAWQDVGICHVGGVSLSVEPARSATFEAVAHTRQIGTLVSFDVNIRRTLWDSENTMREVTAQAVEQCDILKLSSEEAEFLVEHADSAGNLSEKSQLLSLGEILLQRGPRLVIITLGAQGALLLTEKHCVEVPASLHLPVVDTTGAGDAFMGGMLYALTDQGYSRPMDLLSLSETDLHTFGTFANKVASLSCTRYGGISSFPFMDDVNKF